ncbi:MAG: type II toxin-antitoxin system VapC family toxin [Myxococcaceae bacterium]
MKTFSYVLDASALLAVINREPGIEEVQKLLPESCISSVNFSEVVSIMLRLGIPLKDLKSVLRGLVQIVDFSEEHALTAAEFCGPTRSKGLSLGDRACLALGHHLKLPVFTADKAWKDLEIGVKIHLIR